MAEIARKSFDRVLAELDNDILCTAALVGEAMAAAAEALAMATLAAALFADAFEAFGVEDAEAGHRVEDADSELDLLRNELVATLLDGHVASAPAIDLALLGRFYERLGDHAVEIARRTSFVSTGELFTP